METGEAALGRLAALQKELAAKKTFVAACRELAGLCERVEELPEGAKQALGEAGKYTFRVLQTRFSNPKFWQAGLDFFLALDFHLPELEGVATWRDAAMEEVDEEARERAKEQAQRRKVLEDKMHNKGRFSDANTRVTMNELLAASGMILVEEDDSRPGMSRDARNELRVVTVVEEDLCVVCQEAMPAGSKAKSMPCGHKFHDECLISWVKKSNSCPTCRFDEMPSEKKHFDDVQRQVMQGGGQQSGLYA
mmetsp:Transcript_36229/g.73005  ORF Transcript_36229/g.73005 Transcript_36229/m.73005 type:complete len:250 (-) Transcript_36229:255-1004(-)